MRFDSYPRSILNLLKQIIYFEDNFYYLIVLACVLAPSALSNNLPIVFCHGKSGSGKSTLARLVSHVYGCNIKSPDDTIASIKRALDNERYESPETREGERNIIMLWDDIDSKILTDNLALFRFLKVGYDRDSALISIATQGRENISFNVFATKIISSVDNLLKHQKFVELRRRTILIPFKQSEKKLIDDRNYTWRGLSDKLVDFWAIDTAKAFIGNQGIVRNKLKESDLDIAKQQLITDLIATLITCGLATFDDALSLFEQYFKSIESYLEQPLNNLDYLLREYLENINPLGLGSAINANSIKNAIINWKNLGQLDVIATPYLISEIMAGLGYELKGKDWVKTTETDKKDLS